MKYKKQVQGNSVVNVLLTIYNIIGFCETPSILFFFFSCCFKIVDQQSMSHSIIKIIHFEYLLNCIYVYCIWDNTQPAYIQIAFVFYYLALYNLMYL